MTSIGKAPDFTDAFGGRFFGKGMKTMKGSYSSPLVGQYTWVYGAAATPELDGRLIFAGEHTSAESPGFMNGGVESGNRAVKELLGEA